MASEYTGKPELRQFALWFRAALRARGYRPEIGTGLRQYAPHLGLRHPAMLDLLAGRTRPSVPTIEAMARYFGVTRVEIEAMLPQASARPLPQAVSVLTERLVTIPVLDQAAGTGAGRMVVDTLVYVPPTQTAPADLTAIRVAGHCMEPGIPDGSVVVVDTRQSWQRGAVVLATRDDELLLKRVAGQDASGLVRLRADHPDYPEEVLVAEEAILGVAISMVQSLLPPR